LPKFHIVVGAVASILIYFLFPVTLLQTLIIFLSSFLIDADHYFYYIFKKKDINFFRARNWFMKKRNLWRKMPKEEKRKYKLSIIIFHGIEFLIIILILAQFYNIFYFMLVGIIIHLVLDWIEMIYIHHPLYHKLSQIYTLIKNKNKKDFVF